MSQTEAAPVEVRDATTGQFVKGHKGGPGRPKGSRNKLAEDFVTGMHAAFLEKGQKAIERVRDEEPGKFLTVIASIIPKEVDLGEEATEALRTIILNGVRADAHD